ncbi:lipocalin family protein [uncultured Polaribacter sp.]|uniref:lipocalin family protein n=1 Tax=uncultured Polaribacter sp. TaxID=174711 RepID=UPI002634801A|nr:lipocalin family protein [uncultured Polaribacter sp.]
MKKFILLLIIISGLISCNSENDIDLDPIVGSWKIKSILYDNKEIYLTDECNIKSSITFLNDNSIFESNFHKDIKGECVNFEKKYNWINLGKSIYQF